MPSYSEFFLNRSGAVILLECIEFAHPSFSQTYRFVRNATDGVTVTHEDAATFNYEYLPLKIDRGNTSDDLDQTINITLGDLGTIFPAELDRIRNGAYFATKPTLKYRVYRDDDLSAPLMSIQLLEVGSMVRDGTGAATFTAQAAQLNSTKTGEIYSIDRFPMVRGFL